MRMKIQLLLLLVSAFFATVFSIWQLLSYSTSAEVLPFDLLTATVRDLVILLDAGTVTSEQLINEYLARIDENNYKGLKLRAVLEIAPYDSLIEQARQYDVERKEGKVRGPLHGIPILVKDIIATDPSLGMNTTAGSFALRELLYGWTNYSWFRGPTRRNSRRKTSQGWGDYSRKNQSKRMVTIQKYQ